jgi:hypothetical protein
VSRDGTGPDGPPVDDPEAEAGLAALVALDWSGLPPVEPGWALLDAVAHLLARFVAFPSVTARDAVALWTLHAHAVEAFESTPRLALISPEKGSGKTRTLELIGLLVPTALHAVNMTAATLFRAAAAGGRTVLLDEADTYFGPRVSGRHEELRALVNAGHRRGAVVYRCVNGADLELRAFSAYAAVALAGLGDLPDTILDRAVLVRMRRRAPDEVLEPFRHRHVAPPARALSQRIAAWAKLNYADLATTEPLMPVGLADRAADVWEPLLAVAEVAGASWPDRARAAAVELNGARQNADPSLGMRLLADTRTVFDDAGADRLSSGDLVKGLCAIEEAPWGDLRGKPIDARGLASRLRDFDVRPDSVRFERTTRKGYLAAWFHEAWRRYLPELSELHAPPPLEGGTSGTG